MNAALTAVATHHDLSGSVVTGVLGLLGAAVVLLIFALVWNWLVRP